MTRTKSIYHPDQLVHLWANGEARSHYRNASNNVSIGGTDNSLLISYTTVIANRIDGNTVLISHHRYSNTTAKLINAARQATSHLANRFTVDNVTPRNADDHKRNLQHYGDRIAALQMQADKAKTRAPLLQGEADSLLAEAQSYAKRFKVRWQWKGAYNHARATQAAIAKADKARALQIAKQQALDAERFEYWQAGESRYCPSSFAYTATGGVYMRIATDSDGVQMLETSRGATVPLADAIKVFRVVRACKESGKSWKRDTSHHLPVGHFNVDQINSDGSFVAGCHKFDWQQIEAIAIKAGVHP